MGVVHTGSMRGSRIYPRMTFDLSEQPIDYTGITGETTVEWSSPHRRLETVPSIFGPYLRVTFPDGSEMSGAGVLVFDGERILLTRQNRWAIGKQIWEMPLGGRDPGETVTATALREVREETGVTVSEADIVNLGMARPNAATIYGYNQIFFARIPPISTALHGDDEVEEVAWVPVERVLEACTTGEVAEATTIIAVLRAHKLGLLE